MGFSVCVFFTAWGEINCLRMRQKMINLEGPSYVQKEKRKEKEKNKKSNMSGSAKRRTGPSSHKIKTDVIQ